MTEVSCFYSLSSPWAYFAGPRVAAIMRRHQLKVILKPYDFQAVVATTGGVPLRTRPPARRSYHALELDRWRKHLGMPLNLQPRYYPETVTDPDWNKRAGWMVIAAQERGLDAHRLSHALLRALWAEERDISAAEVRVAVANENDLDGAALQAAESSSEVQAIYRRYGAEAITDGIFGAPIFVLDGERFWGQDRLDFLDRALDARRQRDDG